MAQAFEQLHLQVYQTVPLFRNIAAGRGEVSLTELQERVLATLLNGVAVFYFRKKDGQVRKAIGTCKEELIPVKDAELTTQATYYMYKAFVLKDPDALQIFLDHTDAIKSFVEKQDTPPKMYARETAQAFYDLELGEWKSYSINSLMAIIDLTVATTAG